VVVALGQVGRQIPAFARVAKKDGVQVIAGGFRSFDKFNLNDHAFGQGNRLV
jgi:hypothetical protein